MSWYIIHFTVQQNVADEPSQARNIIAGFAIPQASDPEIALFSALRLEDAGVDMWLSPKLARLAQPVLASLRAVPCPKPDLNDPRIGLVIGHSGKSVERLREAS